MVQGDNVIASSTNSISASNFGVRQSSTSSDQSVRSESERLNALENLQTDLMCLRVKHMKVMKENERLISRLYTSDESDSEESDSNVSEAQSQYSDIEEELDNWKMELLRYT